MHTRKGEQRSDGRSEGGSNRGRGRHPSRGCEQALRRHDGGGRPHAVDTARELLRDARPVRLRQDHDAADDRRVRGPDRRPRLPRRLGRHQPPALQARRQHRLSVLRAVPPSDRREERRVRPRAQEGRQGRGDQARQRRARARPARPPGQAQARPALRRPAAARRTRARARQPAPRAAARRAARRARPAAAQAAPDRTQADSAGRRHYVRARDARPGRGHDHGRHDRGDERRQDRAGGLGDRPLRAPPHGIRGQLPRDLEPDRGEGGRQATTSRPTTARSSMFPTCEQTSGEVRVGVRPEKITLVPADEAVPDGIERAQGNDRRRRVPRRLDPVRDQGRRRRGAQRLRPEHRRLRSRRRSPWAGRCS